MGRKPGSLNKSTLEEVNGNVMETIENIQATNNESPTEMKNKAYSIVREEKNGRLRFVVVEIQFDLETGSVGSVNRVEESEDSDSAVLRFKVLSGDEFM